MGQNMFGEVVLEGEEAPEKKEAMQEVEKSIDNVLSLYTTFKIVRRPETKQRPQSL